MLKSRFLFFALAAIGLVTAACSGSATTAAGPTHSPAAAPPTAAVADLAPTGKLRLAVWAGPDFMAAGTPPAGVGVELGSKLAARLNVPVVVTVFDNPAKLVAAAQNPGWDVAILPFMSTLSARVDYSGPVLLVPHTLIVRPGSSIQTLADADQPGIRIASEAGSPHTQVLANQLKHAHVIQVASDTEALAMLKAGTIDAFADGRFTMPDHLAQVPGARVLTEDFFTGQAAMAVTKGHPAGLAYLTEFVEELKASGAVQNALEAAKVSGVVVAPAGSGTPTN